MRILIVQAGFGTGGAEKVVSLLATHWCASHVVRVAGLNAGTVDSYFPYPAAVGRIAVGGRSRGPLDRLGDVRRLRQAVHTFRPDVVVSFLTKVNALAAAALLGTGVPLVVSERNNPTAQAGAFWRRGGAWAASRAAASAMQTRAARDALPARARERAVVIANPCGSVNAAPMGEHFVAVGRLDRQKGFDMLIDAFAPLAVERPGARLVVHGEGPERRALEALVASHGLGGRVTLPGRTATPGGWLREGGIFVLSSRFEGYPNALMEAMAAGMPVAAFDCAWGPADMVEDGGNGLLVPDGDVGRLSAAMARLADDAALRERLGRRARMDAERWAPATVFAAWDDVLARVA